MDARQTSPFSHWSHETTIHAESGLRLYSFFFLRLWFWYLLPLICSYMVSSPAVCFLPRVPQLHPKHRTVFLRKLLNICPWLLSYIFYKTLLGTSQRSTWLFGFSSAPPITDGTTFNSPNPSSLRSSCWLLDWGEAERANVARQEGHKWCH